MKLYSSNHERCMLSTISLASHLLNISASNETKLYPPMIETVTNDIEFNPYEPWGNTICTQQPQYIAWYNESMTDIFDNYINPKRQLLMNEYQDTMTQ